jgi:hypothetical protein
VVAFAKIMVASKENFQFFLGFVIMFAKTMVTFFFKLISIIKINQFYYLVLFIWFWA